LPLAMARTRMCKGVPVSETWDAKRDVGTGVIAHVAITVALK